MCHTNLICFPGFASARVILVVFSSRVLDDRQCFTARSARQKKINVPHQPQIDENHKCTTGSQYAGADQHVGQREMSRACAGGHQ